MENNKLNIGLVGLGYWGPNWLRNIKNHDKYNLSWISDLDKNKLSKFSQIYNLDKSVLFEQYKDALEFKIPDIVLVATPPSTHLSIGEYFI